MFVSNSKGRDHGLDQALESTLDYLKEKMSLSELDMKALLPSVEILTKYHTAETERLKGNTIEAISSLLTSLLKIVFFSW